MATVYDIAVAALQKIGVTPLGQRPEAEELAKAVEAFNFMLSAWALESVDVGAYDLDSGDYFPLDDKFREGAVYVLASRLSPDFMPPGGFDADAWFRRVQTAFVEIEPVKMPKALSQMPSQYWPRSRIR